MSYNDPYRTVTYERDYLLTELKSRQVRTKRSLDSLDTEELLILYSKEMMNDLDDDEYYNG